MDTPGVTVERIEGLLDARLAGDRGALTDRICELIVRPRDDIRAVVLTLAPAVGAGIMPEPGEDFYRLGVTVADPHGGEHAGSVEDLPRHVGVFHQIVTALANRDRVTAAALFDGCVGADWQQASRLTIYGLEQLVHRFGGCPACQAVS